MQSKKIGFVASALALGLGVGFLLSMTFTPAAKADEQRAFAILRDAAGVEVGAATFVESVHGEVRVTVSVRNLSPGDHGMHIHSVGRCEGTGFTSAGSHFNPSGVKHGLQTSDGPHAGDLPNLTVEADMTASFDKVVARFIIHAGTTSLFDADGSALVIHAMPDDGRTDPTGSSGDRIVCGVLTSGSPPSAAERSPVIVPPRTGSGGLVR